MKEQFVTYEIALKLKELCFNEECLAYFNEKNLIYGILNEVGKKRYLTAPLWQQVIDWFREKYGIIIGYMNVNIHTNLEFMWNISTIEDIKYDLPTMSERCFKDYYEAREQAILKAIELCQNKK